MAFYSVLGIHLVLIRLAHIRLSGFSRLCFCVENRICRLTDLLMVLLLCGPVGGLVASAGLGSLGMENLYLLLALRLLLHVELLYGC